MRRMFHTTRDQRDPDEEDIGGTGAESWVNGRRTGYRINAGDRRRTRDQSDFTSVNERLDRIEQALVALLNGDDDSDETNDSINNEKRLSTTERTLDPGQVYGTRDHWRTLDRRTNSTIRSINERNRRHYKN